MPKGAYHVVYRPDEKEWAVEKEKSERASGTFDTKEGAVERAEELARAAHVEMIPHLKDGRISNPNSYGNDPRSIRDQKH